ncbi:MAG: hypothetical protein WDZ82_02770 [Candidatus Paceibacterota bacterium]
MGSWLTNLRKKPPEARQKYALLTAGTITFVLIGVWVMMSVPTWTNTQNEETVFSSSMSSITSTFQDLFESFDLVSTSTPPNAEENVDSPYMIEGATSTATSIDEANDQEANATSSEGYSSATTSTSTIDTVE